MKDIHLAHKKQRANNTIFFARVSENQNQKQLCIAIGSKKLYLPNCYCLALIIMNGNMIREMWMYIKLTMPCGSPWSAEWASSVWTAEIELRVSWRHARMLVQSSCPTRSAPEHTQDLHVQARVTLWMVVWCVMSITWMRMAVVSSTVMTSKWVLPSFSADGECFLSSRTILYL